MTTENKTITTAEEHQSAKDRLLELWDVKRNTLEEIEFQELCVAVDDYEKEHHSNTPLDPEKQQPKQVSDKMVLVPSAKKDKAPTKVKTTEKNNKMKTFEGILSIASVSITAIRSVIKAARKWKKGI